MWVKLIKNKNAWMKTNQMFSNLFSAFGNVVKHALLCLIYYIRNDFIHT